MRRAGTLVDPELREAIRDDGEATNVTESPGILALTELLHLFVVESA